MLTFEIVDIECILFVHISTDNTTQMQQYCKCLHIFVRLIHCNK